MDMGSRLFGGRVGNNKATWREKMIILLALVCIIAIEYSYAHLPVPCRRLKVEVSRAVATTALIGIMILSVIS